MPFSWSAGDIVSAVNPLFKIGTALRSMGVAPSDYGEAVGFLSTLQTTLKHLWAFTPYMAAIYKYSIRPRLLFGDLFLFEDALGRTARLPCSQFPHWEVWPPNHFTCNNSPQANILYLFNRQLSRFSGSQLRPHKENSYHKRIQQWDHWPT